MLHWFVIFTCSMNPIRRNIIEIVTLIAFQVISVACIMKLSNRLLVLPAESNLVDTIDNCNHYYTTAPGESHDLSLLQLHPSTPLGLLRTRHPSTMELINWHHAWIPSTLIMIQNHIQQSGGSSNEGKTITPNQDTWLNIANRCQPSD